MNEREQAQFIRSLTERLEKIHHLMTAYEVAFQFAKDYGVPNMDEILKAAFESPEILAESQKRLASLDANADLTPEADQSESVLEWLRQWKSSGKPN